MPQPTRHQTRPTARGHLPPLWADLTAAAALTWMGVHAVRGYAAHLAWIMGVNLTFLQMVTLLAGVWLTGMAGWFLLPWVGGRRPALRLGLLFGLTYTASHALPVPELTHALAALTVIAWLWCLVPFCRSLLEHGTLNRAAPGMLLGLAGQVGLQTALHGLDLPLLRGLLPGALALALGAALHTGLRFGSAGTSAPREGQTGAPGWGLVGLGPYYALQLVLLCNIGQVGAWSGWGLTAVCGLILAGLAGACALLAWPAPYWARLLGALAGIGLLMQPGSFQGYGVLLLPFVQLCLALALPACLTPLPAGRKTRLPLIAVVSAMLFLALYLEYGTRGSWPELWPVMAWLAALPALFTRRPAQPAGALKAAPALLLLGALGAAIGLIPHGTAKPAQGPPPGELTVMTYNIHQGYDHRGMPAPEAIARVIEESDADLVGLQEVARSVDVIGGADLVAWLKWRLPQYHLLFGAAYGDRQGNVVLSRYPVRAGGSIKFPLRVASEQRGLTWVQVARPEGDLLFLSTHFSAWEDEEPDRIGQAEDVLAFYKKWPFGIVTGDLNQTPDGAPIQRLREGGMVELVRAAGQGDPPTFPAGSPKERIDYLFAGAEITPLAASVPSTTASDHRPVVARVNLK